MVQFDTSYAMPRCKYRYCVTLLLQLVSLGGRGPQLSQGGGPPDHPLEPTLSIRKNSSQTVSNTATRGQTTKIAGR